MKYSTWICFPAATMRKLSSSFKQSRTSMDSSRDRHHGSINKPCIINHWQLLWLGKSWPYLAWKEPWCPLLIPLPTNMAWLSQAYLSSLASVLRLLSESWHLKIFETYLYFDIQSKFVLFWPGDSIVAVTFRQSCQFFKHFLGTRAPTTSLDLNVGRVPHGLMCPQ